ncbi:DUF6807 domain-containing protein [Streptomyces harbinensis]
MTDAPLTVTHTHGERISVDAAGTEILSYVYRPDPEAYESPKPYAHPLRTLAGNLVTGYRPNDHRWHKGVQMTASHLSEQNFWGGNSYIHGQGYQRIPERVGTMRHDGFTAVTTTPERADITENLTWINHTGQHWATETRTLAIHTADTTHSAWTLEWSIDLTNIRGEPLHFGSPTTAGRTMAGYTGLQWRGPRDFTGGQILTPTGPSTDADTMGAPATTTPWIAFTAQHDDHDGHSTLIFDHAPENSAETAIHPSHWFVRSTPIPTVAFSWAFFDEFELPPGDSFHYRYRIVIADGAWDTDHITAYLKNHPW